MREQPVKGGPWPRLPIFIKHRLSQGLNLLLSPINKAFFKALDCVFMGWYKGVYRVYGLLLEVVSIRLDKYGFSSYNIRSLGNGHCSLKIGLAGQAWLMISGFSI